MRKILQLILLEALLYFISFGGNDTISADKHTAIAFMVGVFLVFIVVHVVTYVIDLGIARAMNLDLKEFQKRNS